MRSFLQRHAAHVIGVLNGFDRVRLRGTLRWLANLRGMSTYLCHRRILLKDFTDFAKSATEDVRQATIQAAKDAGRPVEHLNNSSIDKAEKAQEIAARDGVKEGLICVLTAVEPCLSYRVSRSRELKKLVLRHEHMKCLHSYFYLIDPQLGFMHLRLQTWFPFTMHVCINGREWLARQMDAENLRYIRRDNCFLNVESPPRAQELLDQQVQFPWKTFLNRLTREWHPAHRRLFAEAPLLYYWSIDASEWASDVMFRSPPALAALYPRWIRHGLTDLRSADVLRFLGRPTPLHGGVHGRFQGEVTTDLKSRPEGMRQMHRVNRNSIKMYDKQGSVLRVETTINDARDMKVFRRKEGDRRGTPGLRRLRKGVADVARRAKVSQASNERYLESLAAVDHEATLGEATGPLCQATVWQGRRVRALNPFSSADLELLRALSRGEFAINGFRNRDLRVVLYGSTPSDAADVRRQSGKVTRQLRMLRGHSLVQKVAKTHRYQLTANGRTAIAALLAAQGASTAKLTSIAA